MWCGSVVRRSRGTLTVCTVRGTATRAVVCAVQMPLADVAVVHEDCPSGSDAEYLDTHRQAERYHKYIFLFTLWVSADRDMVWQMQRIQFTIGDHALEIEPMQPNGGAHPAPREDVGVDVSLQALRPTIRSRSAGQPPGVRR